MNIQYTRLSERHRRNYLAVLGHINIDVIYELDKLPERGQTVTTKGVKELFGGTAGNIAMHASSLGVRTAVGCYAGDDFKTDYRKLLLDGGVDCYDVLLVRGERTPRCHIFNLPDGEQTCIIEQGAMDSPRRLPLWDKAVRESTIVHIATGDPVRYASAVRSREYSFDPGQEISYRYTPEMFTRLLDGASIFFTNALEMMRAMKLTGSRSEKRIAERCNTVIKTLGSKGTMVIEKDGTTIVPPCRPRRVTDTIGAGDAFRAGFYAAREKGHSMIEAVEFGNAMASISIEGAGGIGGMTSFDRLQKRWKDNYS